MASKNINHKIYVIINKCITFLVLRNNILYIYIHVGIDIYKFEVMLKT